MIGAGARDRVITFQRRVTTRDAANALVETWPFYATARAAMTPLSDAERVRAQEVAASMTTRWVTNWTPTLALVDQRDRIEFTDSGGTTRTHDIVAVKEIGRRQGLEFTTNARAETA